MHGREGAGQRVVVCLALPCLMKDGLIPIRTMGRSVFIALSSLTKDKIRYEAKSGATRAAAVRRRNG